ncbi:MAG: hypothetical protein JJU36_09980 [Phycisphaeraceae bacterium]|nr:hypothetical protein [Phycisphaeraceae bacterium]
MDTILSGIWMFLNSAFGFTLAWVVVIVLMFHFLERLSSNGKPWQKYEGAIITAIKLAEKAIPDDTANAGLRRLDEALRFVLNVYREHNPGKAPSADLVHELKEGIQIKHAELERLGNLRSD